MYASGIQVGILALRESLHSCCGRSYLISGIVCPSSLQQDFLNGSSSTFKAP